MSEQNGDEGDEGASTGGTGEGRQSQRQDDGQQQSQGNDGRTGGTGFDALPKTTQDEIRRLRAEAHSLRTARNEAAEKANAEREKLLGDLKKMLGGGDEEPTVEHVQEQLAETKRQHTEALVELAVTRMADKAGASSDALLDSRAFMRKIGKLDPTSEDFSEKVTEAIRAAVAENPKLGAGKAATRSGGEVTGGSGESSQESSWDEIEKIARAGRKRFGF